ncbi:MAG TPA: hypothetical protein PLP17_13800, partial [Oligoflexia bacterium]|nr:hypothetical protein [Oligoflexia bacterium]
AAGFPEQSASTQCSAAVASCMSEAAAAVRACMTIPDQLQQYSCVRRAGERRTSCVLETNASHPACNAKKYCQDEANTCYNKSAHPMEEYAGMLREKLVQRYNAEVYTVGFVDVVGSHSSPLDRRHDTLIETTGDLDTFHRTLIRYTCSSIPKHEQSGHYFEPHSLDEFDDIVDGILNDSSAAAAPAAQAVRLAAHLIQ